MQKRLVFAALAAVSFTASCAGAQQPANNRPAEAQTTPRPRPAFSIGMAVESQTGEPFVITHVVQGGAAARAGLRVGDAILAVDGRDPKQEREFFPGAAPGSRYTLRIRRGAEELDLVIVADPPASPPQR